MSRYMLMLLILELPTLDIIFSTRCPFASLLYKKHIRLLSVCYKLMVGNKSNEVIFMVKEMTLCGTVRKCSSVTLRRRTMIFLPFSGYG